MFIEDDYINFEDNNNEIDYEQAMYEQDTYLPSWIGCFDNDD